MRGSPGDSRSCTPALTESPSVTHHQGQRTNSTMTSGLGGRISGRIMTRDAGRPMAEPSAPIVSTRLRNNPPNRNKTKKQRRSQTISSEILQARRASPKPTVAPIKPRIDPITVAAVSSCVIRYIGIIRVVHFDAYRETRGEADPVERTLDPRQSIDACAVLRQHGPTEPNDSAAEMPAGLRLQINIHRHARRNVP